MIARPFLLTTFFLLAAAPAWSQDRPTSDRLDRMERDLAMLQRQVYRGASSASAVQLAADPGYAVNSEIRMDRIETQMRELTGRVEEMSNAVDQLRRRLEQINSDIDVRMSQGSGVASAAPGSAAAAPPGRGRAGQADSKTTPPDRQAWAAPSAPTPSAPTAGMLVAPPGAATASAGAYAPPSGPPPAMQSGGTLTPPTGAMAPPPAAPNQRNASAGPGPGGSPTDQYNYAFGLLRQADYPAAEEALKGFVAQHPNDPMAGNAQYWLGESLYARNRYADAAVAFAEGYKRYPKSPKAADDLLKLGMSLGRANQKQNACLALAQLDRDFPNPGPAIKDRSAQERKRIGC